MLNGARRNVNMLLTERTTKDHASNLCFAPKMIIIFTAPWVSSFMSCDWLKMSRELWLFDARRRVILCKNNRTLCSYLTWRLLSACFEVFRPIGSRFLQECNQLGSRAYHDRRRAVHSLHVHVQSVENRAPLLITRKAILSTQMLRFPSPILTVHAVNFFACKSDISRQ